MHKSQGFGVEIERGERKEYFKFLDGQAAPEKDGIMAGIDTTWSRVPKAAEVSKKIEAILQKYDATQPSASVPALVQLRRTLHALGDDNWAREKLSDVDEIIAACLGLHLEAVTEKPMAQPGENLALQIEAINRSPMAVKFESIRASAGGAPLAVGKDLPPNELVSEKTTAALPKNLLYTQPYWLRQPGTTGTYAVSEQTLIGQPENPPSVPVEVNLRVDDEAISYSLTPRFRKVDRVAGEVSEPLVIAPPAFAELPLPVFVFGKAEAKTVNVRVVAAAEKFTSDIALAAAGRLES